MKRSTVQLLVALCVLVIMGSCSAPKNTASKQGKAPLIAPSEIVEKTAPRLDTVVAIKEAVQEQAAANNPAVIDNTLTPEQKAWEMFREGLHKNYDFAAAMHYDVRKPQFVMIHHTSQSSLAQTVRTFQLAHTKVSSHYVIGRDGRVVQMLNDYLRGWHAGRGKWGAITDMNSVSIGIELDNNGREPFPDAQINSLLVLLDTLKTKYSIPQKNFIGHGDFAPGRKDDPNVFFPWQLLAERGFGIWYNPNYLVQPPITFNPIDALKLMGYDLTNQEYAIKAFKRKYIKSDLSGILTEHDKAVLYDLYRKYY